MDEATRAVIIDDYGSNEVLQVRQVERRNPGKGEVCVKIHAAGVNQVDWKIRNGAGARMGMDLPIVLGGEIAGTIVALGNGVDGFAIGDAVFGIPSIGGFAEFATIAAKTIARKPSSLNFVEAAAVPLGALTAWQALFDDAGLASGQRLFITNGSGGVGSMAVQLARRTGAHITTMASGRNEEYVRGLGADAFVDYTTTRFEDVVEDMDVVFDTVGGEVYQRALAVLKKSGTLVTAVAFPDGEGEGHGVEVTRTVCKANTAQLSQIADLVDAGELKARTAAVMSFDQVRQALDLSENGKADGKIVLDIAGR